MYFIRMGGVSVVGSSPEMLVRVEGSRVETHPIAGTRRRGRSDEEDLRLAEELKRNEKERAEHVMLVDLGRNDVGRVCEYGSVRVPQFMGLERFSHVMHLTSIVEGKLAEDCDRLDALVSCFPAGTVSGAPKVRAMQIIRELEPSGRGLYAGAVGYLDFAGNLDFCIAIRTVIMSNGQGLRAGGRRHRHGLEPDGRVRGNAGQGAGAPARRSSWRRRVCDHDCSSSTTTIRSPTTSCSTWASWAPRFACMRNDAVTVDEVRAAAPTASSFRRAQAAPSRRA